MKKIIILSAIAFSAIIMKSNTTINNLKSIETYLGFNTKFLPPDNSSKIQVALLFDTSNSML